MKSWTWFIDYHDSKRQNWSFPNFHLSSIHHILYFSHLRNSIKKREKENQNSKKRQLIRITDKTQPALLQLCKHFPFSKHFSRFHSTHCFTSFSLFNTLRTSSFFYNCTHFIIDRQISFWSAIGVMDGYDGTVRLGAIHLKHNDRAAGDFDSGPDVSVSSPVTRQKAAAAKQFIENHYKNYLQGLQDRKDR